MDVGWRERLVNWRNRRLTDPTFQHVMTRNPLTRWIARRHARGLFDLVAGFVYSQTLAACVRTGLLDLLTRGPLADDEIARAIELSPAATSRLLKAAASLSLVEPLAGDRWALGASGAALLGSPGLVEMVTHHRLLYADLADPVALLTRGQGELAGYWTYNADAGEKAAAYSRLMTVTQPAIAAAVIRAYPFDRHRHLLDIGGGEGAFAQAVVEFAPRLRATVFDLPSVADRARQRLDEAGPFDRVDVATGDFRSDPLPTGVDVISLVRILHDHPDETAAKLLRAIHTALPSNGRLVIAEPMAGTRGAEPAGDAYFGWYLLAMGSGRPRRAEELVNMALLAGFRSARERRTTMPMLCRMIVATK